MARSLARRRRRAAHRADRGGGRGGTQADGSYRLSDEQAKAILELRLQRLTGLERDKIAAELDEIVKEINGYLEILGSRARLLEVLRQEFARGQGSSSPRPRKTVIEDVEFEADIEELIQREDMVVTVSHAGYIKRVPLSTYRAQRRGGRGRERHGDARGGFRQPGLRRLDACLGAVLHLDRARLQAQGLSPAGRHAAGARQGLRQSAAQPGARRDASRP